MYVHCTIKRFCTSDLVQSYQKCQFLVLQVRGGSYAVCCNEFYAQHFHTKDIMEAAKKVFFLRSLKPPLSLGLVAKRTLAVGKKVLKKSPIP